MARLPRFFVPDTPQHVIQRGNDRQPIFRTTADLAFFKDCLAFAARRHGVAIHAYVLMTNHVHLLATPEAATSLPRAMQSVGRVYVQYFNSMQGRSGTLWEGRYKAAIVDSDRYLLDLHALHRAQSGSRGDGRTPRTLSLVEPSGERIRRVRTLSSRAHSLYRALGTTPATRRAAYSPCSANRLPTTRRARSATPRRTRGRWAVPSSAATSNASADAGASIVGPAR